MSELSPRGLRAYAGVGLPLLAVLLLVRGGCAQVSGTNFACQLLTSAQQNSPAAKITAYDVVAIKPNNSAFSSTSIRTNADSFTASGVSLAGLISYAYGVRADQLSGEPAWAESARYDLTAKIVDADPADLKKMTAEDRRPLLQALLADRFHLIVHTESKTMLVYELVIAPGGPKVKEVAAGDEDKLFNGVTSGGTSIHNGHLVAHDIAMSQLIASLSTSFSEPSSTRQD